MDMVGHSTYPETVLYPGTPNGRRESEPVPQSTQAPDFNPAVPVCSTGRRSLGRFALIKTLGCGTFGTVWKARDTLLDRFVAIKIGRVSANDEPVGSVLLQEARLAAQLRHPNIVRIHELGVEGACTYIVSDLVDGVTLAKWLKTHRPSAREAAQLCEKIARALQHSHERGVIHRDLKPGNVMLDHDGEPYVLDFGLARRSTDDAVHSRGDQILGTPAYMPPEQANGLSDIADARADVYSLGVIMYELLTGRLPFEGSLFRLLHQRLTSVPPRLRSFDTDIPLDLEQICLKCLARAPQDRYHSAGELADDLRRFLEGSPVRVRPLGVCARSWRQVRHYPATSGTLAALLATIFLVFVFMLRDGAANAHLAVTRAQTEFLQDRNWLNRMTSFARSPQYALAVAEADRTLERRPLAPSRIYDLACIYALASSSASRDDDLPEADRHARVAKYRSAAIDVLKRAYDAGYFATPDSRTHLQRDPQLNCLRDEMEFKRFERVVKEELGNDPEQTNHEGSSPSLDAPRVHID